MERKDFISQVGLGVAALLVPLCMGGLESCSKGSSSDVVAPAVDFTLDVSTGALAQNGGFMVRNGVIVARTLTGEFIAVSAACTHENVQVNYVSGNNTFFMPFPRSKIFRHWGSFARARPKELETI